MRFKTQKERSEFRLLPIRKTLKALEQKRESLLAEYRSVCSQIRKLKGGKKRPANGQQIKVTLRDSGYTKKMGTVVGVFKDRESGMHPRVILGNGEWVGWNTVLSWKSSRNKNPLAFPKGGCRLTKADLCIPDTSPPGRT